MNKRNGWFEIKNWSMAVLRALPVLLGFGFMHASAASGAFTSALTQSGGVDTIACEFYTWLHGPALFIVVLLALVVTVIMYLIGSRNATKALAAVIIAAVVYLLSPAFISAVFSSAAATTCHS